MTATLPSSTRPSKIRRFFASKVNAAAAITLLILVVVVILAPIVAPADPNLQDLGNRFGGISWSHPLGTDDFGRDTLSRLIYAGRVSLLTPPLAVGIAAIVGIPAGLLAGTMGRSVDWWLGRAADAMLSIPPIVLAIAIVAMLGSSLVNAMIAIGFAYAPRLFRVTRGAAVATSKEVFVESARSVGANHRRIVFRHVLPNCLGPILVQVTLMMGFALLAEASLSFLGLGVQVPSASWGTMLRSAYNNSYEAPWAMVPPGLLLTVSILCFNMVGDGLRDVLSDRGH